MPDRRNLALAALLAAAVCAGCEGVNWNSGKEDFIKPSVAVMKFENRAPFPLGWNLSDGMADILVDRLMATQRYHVIERPELDAVIREQKLQSTGLTRAENRASAGRIKNVQYLIKGTVTDFGHVSNSDAFWSGLGWDIFGGRARAVMGMTLYVVDVESGEIICSETISDSVSANDLEVKAAYSGVSLGGKTFYRTPLGKATERVLDKAVRRITATIASRPWAPKIALVQADNSVIINGGGDHGLKVGVEYDIVDSGAPILDPDTGDVLAHQPGRAVGRVRVEAVYQRYSTAAIVSGHAQDFRPGLRCRRGDAVAAR